MRSNITIDVQHAELESTLFSFLPTINNFSFVAIVGKLYCEQRRMETSNILAGLVVHVMYPVFFMTFDWTRNKDTIEQWGAYLSRKNFQQHKSFAHTFSKIIFHPRISVRGWQSFI